MGTLAAGIEVPLQSVWRMPIAVLLSIGRRHEVPRRRVNLRCHLCGLDAYFEDGRYLASLQREITDIFHHW